MIHGGRGRPCRPAVLTGKDASAGTSACTIAERKTMHEKSIDLLNQAVADELAAVHRTCTSTSTATTRGTTCSPACSGKRD